MLTDVVGARIVTQTVVPENHCAGRAVTATNSNKTVSGGKTNSRTWKTGMVSMFMCTGALARSILQASYVSTGGISALTVSIASPKASPRNDVCCPEDERT